MMGPLRAIGPAPEGERDGVMHFRLLTVHSSLGPNG